MSKKTRNLLISFILLLVGIYGIITYTYKDTYLPNTSVNGVPISRLTVKEADKKLTDHFNSKKYHLTENETTRFTLTGKELGYKAQFKQLLTSKQQAQTAFSWPIALIRKQSYQTTSNTFLDEKKLTRTLEQLSLNDGQRTASKNATIAKNETEFSLENEIYGDEIDLQQVIKKIKTTVSKDKTTINLNDTYIKPTLLASNKTLLASLASLNKLKEQTITLAISKNSVRIPQKTIIETLRVTDKGEIATDTRAITNYVATLAAKYDTNETARSFKTTNKGTITTAASGTYGWSLNTSDTEQKLANALLTGENQTIEPLHFGSGYGDNDHTISGTYVEVDTTDQHMWFYKDGKKVTDTAVVTGDSSKKHDTPRGVFSVWNKERNATLVGEDYKQPVSYWLPIDWTGVGLHDAGWRPKFGGTIYKTSGSHGCVNTPPAVMKVIYDNIKVGTPVVVY
ncbi:L,D-transpeptidase family protein [Brochothrix campestris]|uniref:L,D-TPase catalytic domain-containing protein n=1 Tax=Brochothrix campestris FSL F6-1037 TaxID=1265861 RepID=W7CXC3_9LIST|nr:L,D-transpeptidase family protein [Brochothrix campestris]EUJ41355.1 hypothetical protein BCAMP_03565 [Brochothrix campestris FSL F6-1037]